MIPLMRPQIPGPEEWADLLSLPKRSGQWSNFGELHNRAEKILSQKSDRFALPVTNGTVALEIAAKVVFDPGMRIAIPDFTCAATALAIISAGCEPVIFPCDRNTWTISHDVLREYRDQYDGICVVSPFGYRVDFDGFDFLAQELDKLLIYDLAGAWGMKVSTPHPYSMSFHATKNMCIGEGGAAFFSEEVRHKAAHQLVVFGFDDNRETIWPQGINGKLDEVRSAILLAQLTATRNRTINARILKKKTLCAFYEKHLGEAYAHGLYMGGAPSLCVFGGFNGDLLRELGLLNSVQFKAYYSPLISDMRAFQSYTRCGDTDNFFRTCVAFPSDATDDEAYLVIDLARRCSIE